MRFNPRKPKYLEFISLNDYRKKYKGTKTKLFRIMLSTLEEKNDYPYIASFAHPTGNFSTCFKVPIKTTLDRDYLLVDIERDYFLAFASDKIAPYLLTDSVKDISRELLHTDKLPCIPDVLEVML